jgi:predicted AlkP superfamily pyrophosphatase or phosphodiesterase
MKKYFFVFVFITSCLIAFGQEKPRTQTTEHPKPKLKLVVGIVVDQMRQDYLYRFEKKLGTGGFKRLMGDGFMLKNAHYSYVPTYTGPGHATVFTGTTPAVHGIIGNDWYDRGLKRDVNCVEDERQTPVGSEKGNGDVSPWRMLSSTITDELKLATQKQSKVIGLSLKDRGAVLPAGHMADGAYWFDGLTGKFMSSTFYKPGLPQWLTAFNALNLADQYLNREWKTLLPIEQYSESGPDDSPYETILKGKDRPVFPYKLKELRTQYPNYDLVIGTVFGSDLLTDVAKAAVDGEELGKDDITDFLTLSYSSPDYIGHAMGPISVELEDAYIRLDKNLEDLLNTLDKKVGAGQYLVMLTADHGVADVSRYLKDNKMPAGIFRQPSVEAALNDFMSRNMGGIDSVIEKISNDQIFLNYKAFGTEPKSASVEMMVAIEMLSQQLLKTEGVAEVYPATVLRSADYGEKGMKGNVVRGYHRKRSGDLAFVLEPGWMTWTGAVGTTHGSGYSYDTHVPVLFYGWGIRRGSSSLYHPIMDIAPTLSVLLKIKFPSGCTGQPIAEIVD